MTKCEQKLYVNGQKKNINVNKKLIGVGTLKLNWGQSKIKSMHNDQNIWCTMTKKKKNAQ